MLGAIVLAIAIAIRFAEPIKDGDLFWHLAYARQIVEQHMLVPDPTRYAWTPTSDAMIYCAWLAQLVFYGLWSLGGETAIFALRYVALGLLVALLWLHARRFGLGGHALTPALVLLVVLAAAPVTLPKPELLSVVFTHLLLWLFFGARKADRDDRSAARYLWPVPILVIVWVNSHGGVILAAPLMLALFIGDLINRRMSPANALSTPAHRTLRLAWLASALALLATPYGYRYPQQLFSDYVFNATARPDMAWNNAYQPLFSPGGWAAHLPEYGALIIAILALLGWRAWRSQGGRAALDFTSLLALLVALPLFFLYLRTSYLLPAVFGYTVFPLLALARWRRISRGAVAVGALALATVLVARTAYEAQYRPAQASWSGFGIGYVNPVEEAEWLARHQLGERLYNIFDSGGYLLWRLFPQYRVMVDSRSFPYLGWFDDQYRFTTGRSFEAFLDRYRGDVAVIDLPKAPVWRNFLRSPQWRVVFLGASAAIFVRRDDARAAQLRYEPAAGLSAIRNGEVALQAFDAAVDIGDWRTAWGVVDQLEGPLHHQLSPPVLAAVLDHREACRLALAGNYVEAEISLQRALARKVAGDGDRAMVLMLRALVTITDRESEQARRIEAGLRRLLEQRV